MPQENLRLALDTMRQVTKPWENVDDMLRTRAAGFLLYRTSAQILDRVRDIQDWRPSDEEVDYLGSPTHVDVYEHKSTEGIGIAIKIARPGEAPKPARLAIARPVRRFGQWLDNSWRDSSTPYLVVYDTRHPELWQVSDINASFIYPKVKLREAQLANVRLFAGAVDALLKKLAGQQPASS